MKCQETLANLVGQYSLYPLCTFRYTCFMKLPLQAGFFEAQDKVFGPFTISMPSPTKFN